MINPYVKACFLTSSAKIEQLPPDIGYEVAFVGRSNAGKSSALNTLTNQKRLARTSKTPGRTQLINLFTLDDERRLVDLPGYGYAEVPHAVKEAWQRRMSRYLETRKCLRGMILLADCRHLLKPMDATMLEWALARQIPVHVLLTKADKISRSEARSRALKLEKQLREQSQQVTVQDFSSLTKEGLPVLIQKLDEWFGWEK